MIRFPFLIIFASVFVGFSAASAQDLDRARAAVWQGDYVAALEQAWPLAQQGNADAQHLIGGLYRDGNGVPSDPGAAAVWYERAAAGGAWQAALDLGMLYWGRSVAGDTQGDWLVLAHMWLGIAAETEVVGCVELGAPLRAVVAESMTAVQIAQAEARTHAWLAEHRKSDIDVAAAQPGC